MTLIPLRGEAPRASASVIIFFPIVGLTLGGLAWLTTFFWSAEWPQAAAVVTVVILVILTGGFHLDGLADMADGFSASHNRERVLEIMKDPRSGAFGVMSVVLLLLVKFVALSRLFEQGEALWLIGCVIMGRFVMVDLSVRMSYARREGTAAFIVKNAKWSHWGWALALTLILLVILYQEKGLVLLIGGILIGSVLKSWFNKVLQGATGDLLGAACEVTECLLLFCVAF